MPLQSLVWAGLGRLVRLAASAVFRACPAHFSSYDRVYGVLGAAIAFLVWAWSLDLTLPGGLEVSVALGGKGRDAKTEDAGGS
jgi:uncharacterized BrkB/YihY/UPF0761 family membrane protein